MKSFDGSRPIHVVLADDHAVVRAGYRRLLELEPDIAVVAEFADADAVYRALTAADAVPVDLLVLDLSMPGRSGLDLLQRLARRLPELRVLVFTMHESAAMVQQCLRAGAIGFITKSSAPRMLVEAVQNAARGLAVLPVETASTLCAGKAREAAHERLSGREFDILQQLLAGRGIDEIAQTLHLSVKTVANYQTTIRRTLGVANALGLMHYARDHGLGGA